MVNGDITMVSSYEHDTLNGTNNSLIKLTDSRLVLAYTGTGSDGYIKTFDVNGDGTISQVSSYEHDTDKGVFNSLIKLTDSRLVLAYTGTGNHHGYIKTVDVSSDGTISQVSSYEHDMLSGTNSSLIKLTDSRLVLAYRGDEFDGYIKTFDVSGDGTISQVSSYEHDTVFGYHNSLIKLTDSRVVLAYTGTEDDGYIKTFDIELADIPLVSNICFVGGTLVNTDQCIIEIDKLVPGIHTINNKRITHLTKTYLADDKIILIKRNALGANIPDQDTRLSGFHKVEYNGLIYEAYKLCGLLKNVKLIKYNNEAMYNIMMDKWELVCIHNMIVETLDPNNIIAKLYRTTLSENKKQSLIKEISNATINEDYDKFNLIKNYIL